MNHVPDVFRQLLDSVCPPRVAQVPCPSCMGDGWVETSMNDMGIGSGHNCYRCHGTGFVEVEERQ